MELVPLTAEAWSLNPGTTREVPSGSSFLTKTFPWGITSPRIPHFPQHVLCGRLYLNASILSEDTFYTNLTIYTHVNFDSTAGYWTGSHVNCGCLCISLLPRVPSWYWLVMPSKSIWLQSRPSLGSPSHRRGRAGTTQNRVQGGEGGCPWGWHSAGAGKGCHRDRWESRRAGGWGGKEKRPSGRASCQPGEAYKSQQESHFFHVPARCLQHNWKSRSNYHHFRKEVFHVVEKNHTSKSTQGLRKQS